MAEPTPFTLTDSQKWLVLAAIAGAAYLLYLLAPILTPFAIAAAFAYLGDPITDRLERYGLNRTAAVTVVFVLLTIGVAAFILVLIPLLQEQIVRLVERLPAIVTWLQGHFESLSGEWLGFDLSLPIGDQIADVLRQHTEQIGTAAAALLGSLGRSGAALLAWIINLLLIPVVTFYLLRDWDTLVARVRELIPRHVEPTVSQLASESNAVLGAFLRGQISVMIVLGVVYSVGLWLVGVDLALLIGMVAGLISFVPYLGAVVGVGAGVVAAMFQFQDVFHVVMVLLVFGVGQTLEGMLLTPLLVGDRIGLHPVAVIFFVLAGGQLFGFLGVLIALPAAAVLMVLLRHAHARYRQSRFYSEGASDPAQRVASADDASASDSDAEGATS